MFMFIYLLTGLYIFCLIMPLIIVFITLLFAFKHEVENPHKVY